VLNLVLARGYLAKLLGNPAISCYLKQRQPDLLAEFEAKLKTVSLEQRASGIVSKTHCPAPNPGCPKRKSHSRECCNNQFLTSWSACSTSHRSLPVIGYSAQYASLCSTTDVAHSALETE